VVTGSDRGRVGQDSVPRTDHADHPRPPTSLSTPRVGGLTWDRARGGPACPIQGSDGIYFCDPTALVARQQQEHRAVDPTPAPSGWHPPSVVGPEPHGRPWVIGPSGPQTRFRGNVFGGLLGAGDGGDGCHRLAAIQVQATARTPVEAGPARRSPLPVVLMTTSPAETSRIAWSGDIMKAP